MTGVLNCPTNTHNSETTSTVKRYNSSSTSTSIDVVDSLILDWLIRQGYQSTLSNLPFSSINSNSNSDSDYNVSTLNHRSRTNENIIQLILLTICYALELIKLIKSGQILLAINLIHTNFSHLIQTNSSTCTEDVKCKSSKCILDNTTITTRTYPPGPFTPLQSYFLLLCQQFIEYIRIKDIASAFSWVQNQLSPIIQHQTQDHILQWFYSEIIGLIAYADPMQSPISWLLHTNKRYNWLASIVNNSILSSSSKQQQPPLECVLRHVLSIDNLVSEIGGFAEEIDAKKWTNFSEIFIGTQIVTKPPIKVLKKD